MYGENEKWSTNASSSDDRRHGNEKRKSKTGGEEDRENHATKPRQLADVSGDFRAAPRSWFWKQSFVMVTWRVEDVVGEKRQ
mmetsp:Transcript_9571/g.21736  ORF Transcript_9571/g.21736 Transcript_9571/m.21736 type:complete len:82 (+) Transcript_9571:1030-1275(+)